MVKPLADDLVRFLQTHLGSVWALRLMLAMRAEPERAWTAELLVRELRASDRLIARLLYRFQDIGLVVKHDTDTWHWQPAVAEMEALSRDIAEAYAVTPFGVIQAIAEAPNENLRQLADAFRLRKD
jgi:hypothetical protein